MQLSVVFTLFSAAKVGFSGIKRYGATLEIFTRIQAVLDKVYK